MRKSSRKIPDQEVDVSAAPAPPTPGGLVDQFLEAYAPPIEPFRVILPGGEVFLFKAFQNDAEWRAIYSEAKKVAERLAVDRLPLDWLKVASLDPQRNALAITCSLSMVGWYVHHKRDEDGGMILVGEMQPAWIHVKWLKFAANSPTVFDSVRELVDKGQVSARSLYERAYIEREKKD